MQPGSSPTAGPGIRLREVCVTRILTRTSGYLTPVVSHSVQPYRGCTFGRALCGVGCYVRGNGLLTRGEAWGGFLDVRVNAAATYRKSVAAERRWARARRGRFGIFLSSVTDPFVPQEGRFGVTKALLEAMIEEPPDILIVQTHSRRVTGYLDLYDRLRTVTELRFHLSIESDRDRLPGLPAPACSVASRFRAATVLKEAGHRVVVTVAPLLPIGEPVRFFERIAEVADAVVIDHFIEGDGTRDGRRTLRSALPQAMAAIDPESVTLAYRDRMVGVARSVMPGRVGVSAEGFAGVLR